MEEPGGVGNGWEAGSNMWKREWAVGARNRVTAQVGSGSSFPHGEKWQSRECLYLEKEEEDVPGERKRPREVFGAGPGDTGMGLSGGDGEWDTPLSHGHCRRGPSCGAAAFSLAPSLTLGRGSSAGTQLAALQGGARRLCRLLGAGTPGGDEGMGGAHAQCRGRAGFAGEEGESMRVSKPPFHLSAGFPGR